MSSYLFVPEGGSPKRDLIARSIPHNYVDIGNLGIDSLKGHVGHAAFGLFTGRGVVCKLGCNDVSGDSPVNLNDVEEVLGPAR